jgi:hypothetical protein
MDSLRLPELAIEVVQTPELVYECTWRGKSSDRNPAESLQLWLDVLLATVIDRHGSIEMHFEHIEHFNSSTIGLLIRLIQNCRAKRAKLVMVYNNALRWQSLSFDALKVFVMKDDLFLLRGVDVL